MKKLTPHDSLVNGCLDYINCMGFACKMQSVGIYDPTKGIFRPGRTPGLPDILACIKGLPFVVECKIRGDKQRSVQISWQLAWEKAGGIYLLVYSVDELMAEITKLKGQMKVFVEE